MFTAIILVSLYSFATAIIPSVEQSDGSYSIGLRSQPPGNFADSTFSLLTKAAGWTGNREDYENKDNDEVLFKLMNTENDMQGKQYDAYETGISVTKNVPYVEVLKLVESFLRLKGEVASRVNSLLADNSELIRAVTNTVISKIASLHNFTVTGVVILRKILEFASTLFGQWSVNFGVNNQRPSYGGPDLSALFS